MCIKNCENCKYKEDDFVIKTTNSFPYLIPKFHELILLESNTGGITLPAKAFIKDNNVYVAAEDYYEGSKYILHFAYPSCLLTLEVVPDEYYCKKHEMIN